MAYSKAHNQLLTNPYLNLGIQAPVHLINIDGTVLDLCPFSCLSHCLLATLSTHGDAYQRHLSNKRKIQLGTAGVTCIFGLILVIM